MKVFNMNDQEVPSQNVDVQEIISPEEQTWFNYIEGKDFFGKKISRIIFSKNVQIAKWRSLKKLVQTALREDLIGKGVFGLTTDEASLVIPLWHVELVMVVYGARSSSLKCYPDISRVMVFEKENGFRDIVDPVSFLDLLGKELDAEGGGENFRRFSIEINNSVLNNALCLSFRDIWNEQIKHRAIAAGYENLLPWIRSQKEIVNTALFLEQWSAVGHPYHPCDKAKLGMLPSDIVKFSPEFQGRAGICLAAIRKQWVHVEMMSGLSDIYAWFDENFSRWFRDWKRCLVTKGLIAEEYVPFPLHPWQAEHTLPERFKDLLEADTLVFLDGPKIDSSATLSFRTLVPEGSPSHCHIKLPITVRLTSVYRTVSPRSAQMGPRISRLMQDILETESGFGRSLDITPEVIGMHYAGEGVNDDDAKHLSVIFRSNPMCHVGQEEDLVPVAALLVRSPISEKPLFVELMGKTYHGSLNEVLQYFRDYVRISLNSILKLYLRYGIALEAHQQNTFAIFSHDGKIKRLLVRDFGGIRIHRPTLESMGYQLKLHDDNLTVVDDRIAVREKLLHTIFQSHLGELALMLATELSAPERLFWKEIGSVVIEVFGELRGEMRPSVWSEEYVGIMEKNWKIKSFMRMRLEDTHHYIHVSLQNPLAKSY